MEAEIEIVGLTMIVEYVFKITSHAYPATGPSYASGGEPGGPAEFEIEVLGIAFPKQHADVELELPTWLKDTITTHLYDREDINEIIQRADYEDQGDPDWERDLREEFP
jgi:hypothetical protein